MNVPGSNLLSMALGLISPQRLEHSPYMGRTTNDAGDDVAWYGDPRPIEGSMQPVNRALYQQLGLNLEKNYSTLYTSVNVGVTERDRAGDRFTYSGKVWEAESDLDWRSADGWRKVLCVEVRRP